MLDIVLQEFGISDRNIVAAVTGNDSNFAEAIKMLGIINIEVR